MSSFHCEEVSASQKCCKEACQEKNMCNCAKLAEPIKNELDEELNAALAAAGINEDNEYNTTTSSTESGLSEQSQEEDREQIIIRYYSYGTGLLEEFAFARAAAQCLQENQDDGETFSGPLIVEQVEFLQNHAIDMRNENRQRAVEYLAMVQENEGTIPSAFRRAE